MHTEPVTAEVICAYLKHKGNALRFTLDEKQAKSAEIKDLCSFLNERHNVYVGVYRNCFGDAYTLVIKRNLYISASLAQAFPTLARFLLI